MHGLAWPVTLAGWVPPGLPPELPPALVWLLASALLLLLAAGLTPRRWWRQATLLGMLGIIGGGYVLARLLGPVTLLPDDAVATVQAGARNEAARLALAKSAAPTLHTRAAVGPGGFLVHQPLNLRRAAGTDAAWLATLPGGTRVWPTGQRQGDWWQVASLEHTGWVNSLWLRQIGENTAAMR
jgi:hypothetical protein